MKQAFIVFALSLFFAVSGFAQSTPETAKLLSATEFKKMVDTKSALIVDVRTPEEFSEGHIPGAINIDVHSPAFLKEIKKLSKTKPLALYCKSGRRSHQAATQITGRGFIIYELNNGFMDWVKAGFPSIK